MAVRHAPRTAAQRVPVAALPGSGEVCAWLGAEAAGAFAVPWLGVDVLGLEPDLFYLGYFTLALAFGVAFVRRFRAALAGLWRPRLVTSLVVGAVVGLLVLATVLRDQGTGHPGGWRYVVDVVWRGPVYGAVDALVLFVLPAAAAYLLLRGDRRTTRRRLGFAGLALVLSTGMTAAYHLGYPEFRDRTLRYPELGAVAASIPTITTGNPLGAVATHVVAHTGAVLHQYDGGEAHMLPPRSDGEYPARGSASVGAGLAAVWMAGVAAGAWWLLRRRRPG